MFLNKPIIGMAGGIGSGKSFVARCFEPFGWLVINSDEQAKSVYADADVQRQLQRLYPKTFDPVAGGVTRSAIANLIFREPKAKAAVEAVVHPAVNRLREQLMTVAAADPAVVGFVWDTPLLFEAGLDKQCDWIVFVDAPAELRAARVREKRGWSEQEIGRREISHLPLDTKRKMSQDVVRNTSDQTDVCSQIEGVLSRIAERFQVRTVRPAGS